MKRFQKSVIRRSIWAALALLLLLTAAVLGYSLWQNTTIGVSRYTIESDKIPAAFDGCRIVQLSDLHNADFGSQLVETVRAEQPDIIVLTGDWITYTDTDITVAKAYLPVLCDIAPVYYVAGNHEARAPLGAELTQALIDSGVTLLENRAVLWTKGTQSVNLIGVYDPEYSTHLYKELPRLVDGERYNILLYHRPEQLEECAAYGVDLVLSGHAHGGQVRLPLIGGLFAPNQGLFPRYTAGIYTEAHTTMVVSRGLGNAVWLPRILNPPEIVTVTLKQTP